MPKTVALQAQSQFPWNFKKAVQFVSQRVQAARQDLPRLRLHGGVGRAGRLQKVLHHSKTPLEPVADGMAMTAAEPPEMPAGKR